MNCMLANVNNCNICANKRTALYMIYVLVCPRNKVSLNTSKNYVMYKKSLQQIQHWNLGLI